MKKIGLRVNCNRVSCMCVRLHQVSASVYVANMNLVVLTVTLTLILTATLTVTFTVNLTVTLNVEKKRK